AVSGISCHRFCEAAAETARKLAVVLRWSLGTATDAVLSSVPSLTADLTTPSAPAGKKRIAGFAAGRRRLARPAGSGPLVADRLADSVTVAVGKPVVVGKPVARAPVAAGKLAAGGIAAAGACKAVGREAAAAAADTPAAPPATAAGMAQGD